jgi:phosphatidylserine/phosphatidylglycerophosphate/cardiolipin synthase-like enzyme
MKLWPLLAGLCLACHPQAALEPGLGATPTYRVYFSPKGGCEAQVAGLITSSKTKLRMLAYSFTSKPIRDAPVAQQHPTTGSPLDIGVILDESDTKVPSVLNDLLAAGIPTWIDSVHPIAHNKVVLSDDKTLETGSFNFTNQAERGNGENCLFVRNTALVAQYNANWELHKSHSRVATPVPPPAPAPSAVP